MNGVMMQAWSWWPGTVAAPSCAEQRRPGVAVGGTNLIEVEPGHIAYRLVRHSLLEEEDVDNDVGAGGGPEAAFGQADGGDEIGGFGDVLARGAVRLVKSAGTGDEGRKPARLQQVD
jgi:hypothetical protein